MIDSNGVLMIEPQRPASPAPTIDYWTFMTALVYERTQPSKYAYRGVHTCGCGAQSDNYDHILPDGRITNSLAVHYVAYHRHEASSPIVDELLKIGDLFKELFPDFDFEAFDADQDRQRELIAAIPAPVR